MGGEEEEEKGKGIRERGVTDGSNEEEGDDG